MTELQAEAAKIQLKKMMAEGHFSICCVDDILKCTGGVPNGDDYRTLRMLHCVKFMDFSQKMRAEFPALLQRVLESPSMGLVVRFEALTPRQLLPTQLPPESTN